MNMQFSKRVHIILVLIAVVTGYAIAAIALTKHIPTDPSKERGTFMNPLAPIEWSLSRLQMIPGFIRKRHLVGVMIENHQGARPHHEGLENALIIAEFPVEGLISRFTAYFDADSLPEEVGPIRSLRPYFLDFALPIASAIVHAGGSPEALEKAHSTPNFTAINGLLYDHYFYRKEGIPAPHDLFLSGEDMHTLLEDVELQEVNWPLLPTGSATGSGAQNVFINFYNPEHDITYAYDPISATYERTNGSEVSKAHPTNVLVLEMPITNIGEYGRLTIPVTGKGYAALFNNGRSEIGRWTFSRQEGLHLENSNGEPMRVARGQIWITVIPMQNRLSWE